MEYTTFGALVGLFTAVYMILKRAHPAYSLMFGAFVGGIAGGGTLETIMETMMSGAKEMMPSVLRILAAGMFAGTLIKTGSAWKIAATIIGIMGSKRTIAAIAISTMVLCSVGVFVDIAVITMAPVALSIGKQTGLDKKAVLLALAGGGRAGNLISPNPNTIAVAEIMGIELPVLMLRNIVPAILAVVVTIVLATWINKRQEVPAEDGKLHLEDHYLPELLPAIIGPVVVMLLLAFQSLFDINVDPLVVLPLGGIACVVASGHRKHFWKYTEFGLSKVMGVAVLIVGTGTLAGVITASDLQEDITGVLGAVQLPAFLLAPVSGILMSGATASTTAGVTIAAQTFSGPLVEAGIGAVSVGAMIHAGGIVFDTLPHGSFFHTTAGAVRMKVKERMQLLPYEILVGFTAVVVSVIQYVLFL